LNDKLNQQIMLSYYLSNKFGDMSSQTSLWLKLAMLSLLLLALVNGQNACGVTQCAVCSSGTTCSSCNAGFKLNTLGTLCLECNIPNCAACSSTNICGQCNGNFTVFTGGQSCTPCNASNCQYCNFENNCQTCMSGYTSSQGVCYLCNISNCVTCTNNNVCGTCATNFNPLPTNSSVCVSCNVP
jgi:hypothetical protein